MMNCKGAVMNATKILKYCLSETRDKSVMEMRRFILNYFAYHNLDEKIKDEVKNIFDEIFED